MPDLTPDQFAARVLRGLGITPSRGAVKALVGWQRAEGGHWNNRARYNPLNTTQPEPGAGNTGSQGNIKVYTSWDQGVDATVKTLKNGRYGSIISALQGGDANAVANAIGGTPWGTSGDLVRRTIAGTKTPTSVPPADDGDDEDPARYRTTTTTTPGIDNRQARAQLILNFLNTKKSDPVEFAMQARALQDTPGTTNTTRTQIGGGSSGTSTGGTSDLASFASQRADIIDKQALPYQWGGGHAGKTAATKAIPLDCSGAVSKVLGIDPRVADQFKTWGRPGDGGNKGVTIYSKPDHVLMKINGKLFGTSGSNPGGGAGWIDANDVSPGYLSGFTARHSNR